MKLPVLSAADGAAWEERLVTALSRGAFGVEIVRRCVDVVELAAVAASGQGRAALVGAGLRRLDADVVDRLRAAQVAPVGVVERGDEAAERRMRAMGVLHLVPDDVDAAVLAAVVTEAVRDEDAPPGTRRTFTTTAVPLVSAPIPPGAGAPLPDDDEQRRGSVIAVWGPTGAPGRTTVATTLADEIGRLGARALAVDADVYGGTLAPLLGLLDESPGLAAACRQASASGLDAAALARLCWQIGPQLRILTGIPLAGRWPELRPTAVAAVLATARRLVDYTVVDCGFGLETDEELSFDTLAPRRNGATLAVLDDADLVLAIGSADPLGMQRLVRGLAELRDAEVGGTVWVVLNRVRGGVVPGNPDSELRAALERFAGHTPAALLPYDLRAVDAALARGQLLAEAAPASPLRCAVRDLAAAVMGVDAPARAGRRRR
jgi:MinD-like ATPase involved in chromosome partitioning or flagellar assembly